MKIDSSYLHETFEPKKVATTVRGMVKLIKESGIEFDTVVFRGMSGALMGPIIAHRLKKCVAVCRKSDDTTHSGHRGCLEGNTDSQGYIIIDDFISSGNTVNIILNAVKHAKRPADKPEPKCVGIFLYRSCRSMPFDGSSGEEQIPVFSHELLANGKSIFYSLQKRAEDLIKA